MREEIKDASRRAVQAPQFIKAYAGYQELGDSFTAHNRQVALKRIQANDYIKYKDDLHCVHKGEYP
jgi:hypothetical protein